MEINILRKLKLDRSISAIRFLIVWCAVLSGNISPAASATSESDGIRITVTASKEDSGKTLVSSILFNGSQFPICSASLNGANGVFYCRFLDSAGEEIPQNKEWAKWNAQKSSMRYQRPRSFTGLQVDPGKDARFDFYLEDAYEDRIVKGVDLVVSWESVFLNDTPLSGGGKYMFPQRWAISASLPLRDKSTKELENTNTAPSGKVKDSKETVKFADSHDNKFVVVSKRDVVLEQIYSWWWMILIAIVLFITYSLKFRRKSKSRTSRG